MKNTISDVDNYKIEYVSDLSGIFALNHVFGNSNCNKNSRELLVDILRNEDKSNIKMQKLASFLGVGVKDVRWSIGKMREILKSKADEYDLNLEDIIDELVDFIN